MVGLPEAAIGARPAAVLRRPAPAGRDRPGDRARPERAGGRRAGLGPRRHVQATILKLLQDLQAELGLTLLFISHNLAVVRHLCDRVAVMYLGRIIEVAPTEELFRNPRHPYAAGLLAAHPRMTARDEAEAPALQGDPPSPLRCRPAAGSAPGARSRRTLRRAGPGPGQVQRGPRAQRGLSLRMGQGNRDGNRERTGSR